MTDRIKAPFIHTEYNDAYSAAAHLVSLVPAVAVGVVFYGLRAAILIVFCSLLFALSDDVCARIRKVSRGSILNPLFNGAVIALLLPPDTPLYAAASGVLFASVVVRQLSGGRGSSFINAVCAGRLFIRIVFPLNEAALALPGEDRLYLKSLIFGAHSPEPVDLSQYYLSELITGRFPSFIGTSCAVILLAGMIYLIAKRVLKPYLPACYLGMLTLLLLIKDIYLGTSQTGMFVLTSGILFTAAYLVFDDDTVKSFGPVSVVQAFLCAALTFLASFRMSGVDLLIIPVLITGILTDVLDFSDKVIKASTEGVTDAES